MCICVCVQVYMHCGAMYLLMDSSFVHEASMHQLHWAAIISMSVHELVQEVTLSR